MKKLPVFLLLSLASVATMADNTRGFYTGVGYNVAAIKDNSLFDKDVSGYDGNFGGVELFGGYKYNSALGVEIRVGMGVSDKGISSEAIEDGTDPVTHTLDTELAIDRYEALYYRPELANEEAKLYALLGYTRMKRSETITNTGDSTFGEVEIGTTESGFSYGVGVGFVVNKHLNLNFEYRRMNEGKAGDTEIAGVNLDYRY